MTSDEADRDDNDILTDGLELQLLQEFGAHQHCMSSLPVLPEMTESDEFAKQKEISNLARPAFGFHTLGSVDLENTHRLLHSLQVESVPAVSPKTHQMVPPFVGKVATPNPNSPQQQKSQCALDDDMLNNCADEDTDDDSDEFAADNFQQGALFSQQGPRKTRRPQSPTSQASRPPAVTVSKRATSNVAETPETRGGLVYQEDYNDDSFSGNPYSSLSCISSVKKASLGRDRSAQSRLLKQQYMPHTYGPSTGSFSTVATNASVSTNGWAGGWPTNLSPFNGATSPAPTTPMKPDTSGTPRTYTVTQDFGKLMLNHGKGSSPQPPQRTSITQTAEIFDDMLNYRSSHNDPQTMMAVEQMPMELMVNRPAPLMWRNLTSTIEALDLR